MVTQFPLSQELVDLRNAMHQLLEESWVPRRGAGSFNGIKSMARPLPIDMYATPDQLMVIAAVPGMNPRDLEITYNQNTITLAGSLPTAADSEQGQHATWYLRELWSGQFQRSVTLPFEVDADKAEATFDNGVVRITLPKAEWTKPQKIAISAARRPHEAISAGKQETSR